MSNKLTDEQVELISDEMDKAITGTPLEYIKDLPSNNGVSEREAGTEVQEKEVLVTVDPNTGEHSVIGNVEQTRETFEEMAKRLEDSEIEIDNTPITEEEIIKYIANADEDSSIVKELLSGDDELNISPESTKKLLEIANRKMNREEFNVYKEFPDEIKIMVDNYISVTGSEIGDIRQRNKYRNMLCEELISEFITNISIDRVQHDFSKEMEDLFSKANNEIADSVIGYTTERNQLYRDYANKIEDPEKKEKILEILDRIDDAYKIDCLKEFAKKCKIKNIEFEKPHTRVYDSFLSKYKESSYNIYSIDMASPILFRNINTDKNDQYTIKDINAFFICFCKYCLNMNPNNSVLDHAFMYYVIYNIVLTDVNKGESINVSNEFLNNVKEVIKNLREKNNYQ
jgi:hypothetical protein